MVGMAGYTKLFSSLIGSTIWRAPDHTRLVFITMLAMADKNGIVEASIPGLADLAHVSIDNCKRALADLQAPDEYSRTKDEEGRRIFEEDGGWRLINHAKYRAKMSSDDRREYNRKKQAEYRAAKRESTPVEDSQQMSTESAHTEAKAKADTKAITKRETRLAARTRPPEDLRSLWNDGTTAPIPKCRELSPKRTVAIRARLSERPWSEWVEVVARIDASPFCRGQNDRGWVASFDWLIQTETAIKVLEGKYDDRAALVPVKPTSKRDAHMDAASAEVLAQVEGRKGA